MKKSSKKVLTRKTKDVIIKTSKKEREITTMTQTKYKFNVYFKDNTMREYYATSYATLYEYFLLTPRLEYSIDDIERVDLIREYYYHSIRRNARCKCEVTEDQYDRLAKDFQKHYDIMVANGVDTVDVYIQTYMSLNY